MIPLRTEKWTRMPEVQILVSTALAYCINMTANWPAHKVYTT